MRYFDDFLFHSDDPYLMTEQNQYYGALTDGFIAHHGIKGQKWGVRRFQNYDGTRIKKSDMVLKKGSSVYRYSNKKESGSLEGSYAFVKDDDAIEYLINSKNAQLGFKDYNEILMTKISVLDEAKVRRGADTVKDIVDKIGDVKVEKAYNTLLKAGYMDDRKNRYDRYKIWSKNKETRDARNTLGGSMHRYLYDKKTSKDTRKTQLDEYKKQGYDAIVDPEDFIWNYEIPMVLLNDSKFKRTGTGVVWDKSFKETKKMAKDAEKLGKTYDDFTDKDWEAISKVKKLKI